jgi:16S rRNA processing protein RimM
MEREEIEHAEGTEGVEGAEGRRVAEPLTGEPLPDWDEMVLVGFVARTHGTRGAVILKSETDFPEDRFRVGATLYARVGDGPIQRLLVTAVRFQQGKPILGIAGFSSIDEAERLTGAVLKVPESEQQPLPEGNYYHHQLIGCEVVTASGDPVGTVSKIDGAGEATRLVVRGRRAEVLIPLVDDICRVDVGAKRILVTPPEGLLEVNGEWRE